MVRVILLFRNTIYIIQFYRKKYIYSLRRDGLLLYLGTASDWQTAGSGVLSGWYEGPGWFPPVWHVIGRLLHVDRSRRGLCAAMVLDIRTEHTHLKTRKNGLKSETVFRRTMGPDGQALRKEKDRPGLDGLGTVW